MLTTSILLRYETWMIIGVTLVILDVVLGLAFFSLSFGLGAFIAGLVVLLELPYSDSWEGLVSIFGVSSVLVLLPLRQFARKNPDGSTDDINKY